MTIVHQLLLAHCSEYITQCASPLYKVLPDSGAFQKVKVRHKTKSPVHQLIQSKVSTDVDAFVSLYSYPPDVGTGQALYHVYPIDGFRSVFCSTLTNSEYDLQRLINVQSEYPEFSLLDQVQYQVGLPEPDVSCEVLVFDIPFFYAVKIETGSFQRW